MTGADRLAAVALAAVLALGACAADPPSAVVGLTVYGCEPGIETGSGVLVEPDLVLASAHVVAGADEITVYRPGWSETGEVVAFDDEMDLAYVRIQRAHGSTLDVDSDGVQPADTGVAYVFRDGEPTVIPVRIDRRVRINTEDIYVEGHTVRPGFLLEADLQRGDSGGPVVVDGTVVGVLWARSRGTQGRAYAIDPERAGGLIREQVATGKIADGIDPSRCAG